MEHQKGRWSKATLKKGEHHHLQRSSCYKINKQSIFTQEYSIAEPTPNDIYIKGSDGEKTYIDSKTLKEETQMTIERHGPEFVKDQQNFVIYDALLYRTGRKEPKKMPGSPSMG